MEDIDFVAVERDVPREKIIDLWQTLSGDPESEEDFDMIEDLSTVIAFSRFEEKRQLAGQVLSKMLGTQVQVYKMTAEPSVFIYLTFNGIEDGFFHVGTYPSRPPLLEECLTPRQEAVLTRFCESEE